MACGRLVLLVTVHFALCSLPGAQAHDARHHGRYDQKSFHVDFPFVPQRQLSMVPPCQKTKENSLLQYTVIDVPFVQVVQVHLSVVAQSC